MRWFGPGAGVRIDPVARAGLALGGLLAGLLICEGLLRLGGWLYHAYRLPGPRTAGEESVRVLCLGDSWTFGVGARKGKSYPEQLERKLEEISSRPVRMFNHGVPGANSSEVLASLKHLLQRYRPDAVIVLIGVNNEYNFHRSNYHLFVDDRGFAGLDVLLSNLRTYKLLMSSLAALTARRKSEGILRDPKFISSDRRVLALLDRVHDLRKNVLVAEADALLREEARKHPAEPSVFFAMGELLAYAGKDREAIEWLEKAKTLAPRHAEIFVQLFTAYRRCGDLRSARRVLSELKKFQELAPWQEAMLLSGVPAVDDTALFIRQLEDDLEGIIRLCRKHRAELILQTYPAHDWPNETLRAMARGAGLALVDHELYADEAHLRGGRFAEDGHFNDKGYALMTSKILDALLPKLRDHRPDAFSSVARRG